MAANWKMSTIEMNMADSIALQRPSRNSPKRYSASTNKHPTAFWACSIVLGLILPTAVAASGKNNESQSLSILRETALNFLHSQTIQGDKQDIEISVGRTDRRLQLTACNSGPKAFLTAGAKLQGKVTVGLRCSGPKPWTVYIPAHIKIYTNVVSAAHPLRRGDEVSSADLISVRQEVSQLRGNYFTEKNDVIGKVIKQTLTAGQAITEKLIEAPILVHRGEKVSILASIGGLQVRGKGEALKDAARGERVSVRNSRSKRIVQGIATAAGTVSVRM